MTAFPGWVWPMPRVRQSDGSDLIPIVTSGFGPRPSKEKPEGFHRGVDILYKHPTPTGVKRLPVSDGKFFVPSDVIPVIAAGPGKVWRAGVGGGGKIRTVIDHGNVAGFGPLCTFYTHQKLVLVAQGDTVVAGQVIGVVGRTGTDLNHCHFSFWCTARGGAYEEWTVDPKPFLAGFGMVIISPPDSGPGGTWPKSGLMAGSGQTPGYPMAGGVPNPSGGNGIPMGPTGLSVIRWDTLDIGDEYHSDFAARDDSGGLIGIKTLGLGFAVL